MEFDITQLISYLTPIIAALGTLIAAIVKIKELGKEAKNKIDYASKTLKDENSIKNLQTQLSTILKENAELKKMLKREIELQTRVRYDDDTANKKS
jgi:vacuolar-type H+-ATPase subunit I/STV1